MKFTCSRTLTSSLCYKYRIERKKQTNKQTKTHTTINSSMHLWNRGLGSRPKGLQYFGLRCRPRPFQTNSDLTLDFLVAVVNTLNTKTHSSKEKAEFSFGNADGKSICYCKQRVKSKLSLSSECVETKLCKPCTYFTLTPTQLVWNGVE